MQGADKQLQVLVCRCARPGFQFELPELRQNIAQALNLLQSRVDWFQCGSQGAAGFNRMPGAQLVLDLWRQIETVNALTEGQRLDSGRAVRIHARIEIAEERLDAGIGLNL